MNKYEALQQFFRWLVIEGEVERSPMDQVPRPTAVQKLVEVLSDEETRRILEVCEGRGFVQLRDQALVWMFYNTGAVWLRSAISWCLTLIWTLTRSS